jgi:hypothetical protein
VFLTQPSSNTWQLNSLLQSCFQDTQDSPNSPVSLDNSSSVWTPQDACANFIFLKLTLLLEKNFLLCSFQQWVSVVMLFKYRGVLMSNFLHNYFLIHSLLFQGPQILLSLI